MKINKGRVHNYYSRYNLTNDKAEKELIKRHKDAEKIRINHSNFMYDFYNPIYNKARNRVIHQLAKEKVYVSYASAYNAIVRGVSLNKLPSKQAIEKLNYSMNMFYNEIDNEQYRQKTT